MHYAKYKLAWTRWLARWLARLLTGGRHHIYPKAHLATQSIPFHQSNVIANICLLSSADNRAISDESPVSYMPKIPAAQKEAIAEGAIIPRDMFDGTRSYTDFIAARSALLASTAERLIEKGTA